MCMYTSVYINVYNCLQKQMIRHEFLISFRNNYDKSNRFMLFNPDMSDILYSYRYIFIRLLIKRYCNFI